MQDKIFISHSSAWKDSYVIPLTELMGRDLVVVDKYNFESAQELWPEIQNYIDQCRYFLFLISKEALVKDGWVEKEIGHVLELVVEGKVLFWPVIIDRDIDWSDSRIKEWIKKRYIINKIPTPTILAHILRKKLRKDLYDRSEFFRQKRGLFMGRDEDISYLKGILKDVQLNNELLNPNTIIVSGLRHLGRKRFLQEFLLQVVKLNLIPGDASIVSLSSTDDEWAYLQKLNNIVGQYPPTEIDAIVGDDKRIKDLIVELVTLMRDSNLPIIIEDDGAIVRRNGYIAEWFLNLTRLRSFKGEILFNIVSRFRPRPDIDKLFQGIIATTLSEIPREWLVRIMKQYANICGLAVNDSTVNDCVSLAAGFPKPVYAFVDALKKGDNKYSAYKGALKSCVATIESNFKVVVDEIKAHYAESLPTLILLSQAPFLSEYNLSEIIGPEVYEHIDVLNTYGVIEYSGKENSLVSLNSGLADYVRRSEKKLPYEIEKRFKDFATSNLKNLKNEDTDLGGYLVAMRESIKANIDSIPTESLVPSIILRLMTEYYYQKDNKSVISMADQLLKSYKAKYRELERPVHYWLCSALCREANPRLKTEIKYFNEDSYSYNFLMGFYYRHSIKTMTITDAYKKAKGFYEKAHELTFKNDSEFDDAKLLHELWMIKFELGEPDALNFAESCYKRRPTNPFHIEAYFRSLVRSKNPDISILNKLVQNMKKSVDVNRSVIADTMIVERDYLTGHHNFKLFIKDIERILNDCVSNHEKKYPCMILREMCKHIDSMVTFSSIKKKYGANDVDTICRIPD